MSFFWSYSAAAFLLSGLTSKYQKWNISKIGLLFYSKIIIIFIFLPHVLKKKVIAPKPPPLVVKVKTHIKRVFFSGRTTKVPPPPNGLVVHASFFFFNIILRIAWNGFWQFPPPSIFGLKEPDFFFKHIVLASKIFYRQTHTAPSIECTLVKVWTKMSYFIK